MLNRLRPVPASIALFTLLVSSFACEAETESQASGTAASKGAAVSEKTSSTAPLIRFVDLATLETEISSRVGKGALLNFWAIWCIPCVAELPDLVEVAEEFRDQGGVVLSVSYDLMIAGATRDKVMPKMRDFVARKDLNFPVFIYDEDDYDGVNDLYGLPGPVPVTLAFDSQGNIVDRQEGQAGKERFAEMMRRALRK